MIAATAVLVEAKPWHCGPLSRRLRREHRDLLVSMKVRIHAEMRAVFDSSLSCRKTLFVDGKMAAMGGITGTALSAEGEIWLAVSEDAVAHAVMIARIFKRELDLAMQTRRRLVTIVFKDDRKGMMLAYFLGFRVKESTRVSDRDAVIMEIVRVV
jgi:hypothetical protein